MFFPSVRVPTHGPNKVKRSGKGGRAASLCAGVCLLVFLSWSRVVWVVFVRCAPCPLPCLLLFPGRLFLVGTVPKIGHVISGFSLPRPRHGGRFYPGFMAVTYGAASLLILVDLSLLSTLRRLISRAAAAAVSASISPTSLRRRFCPLLRHRQTPVDFSVLGTYLADQSSFQFAVGAQALVLERAEVRRIRHHRPPTLLRLTLRMHVARHAPRILCTCRCCLSWILLKS